MSGRHSSITARADAAGVRFAGYAGTRHAARLAAGMCGGAAVGSVGIQPRAAAVRQFLQTHLQPWRLLDAPGSPAQNTVTGYYEPLVHASRTRQANINGLCMRRPADLLTIDLGAVYPELAGKRVRGKLVGKRVVPYDTRAEIAQRQPNSRRLLSGSTTRSRPFSCKSRVRAARCLPNGETIRLAYADHNGRPYASIGKWLADKGELPLAQASMQNIKAWAKRNPGARAGNA